MADRDLVVPSWRPGRWTIQLDAASFRAMVAPVRDWLADPGSPRLELNDSEGNHFDHDSLLAVLDEAVEVIDEAVSRRGLRRGLRTADLVMVSGAAQNIGVVAYLASEWGAPALELVTLCEQLVVDLLVTLDRRFTKTDDGTFIASWTSTDREIIEELAGELDASLGADDPDLVRLSPPAYGTDAERSEGYAVLAGGELIESRRAALAVLREAVRRDTVTVEELGSMMRAVNDLRLVLGTRLDVSETDEGPMPGHPDAPAYAVYRHLTHLLSQILDALRQA